MKRVFLGMTGLAVALVLAGATYAQGANPRGKSEVMVGGKTVSVEYGRPSLKGRTVEDLLGQLPAGQVWRLGADTSTTISTTGDVMFGDTKIAKGDYSLWARKEADKSWKLVFNSQHGQWGTQHDDSKDVAAVSLKESKAAKSSEEVTITLSKADMGGKITILWGDLELSTDFK